MSQDLYSARRAKFIELQPDLARRLPEEWPQYAVQASGPDMQRTRWVSNQSPETLVIGFSGTNGSWGEYAAAVKDVSSVVVTEKHITVFVLPEELGHFATHLGRSRELFDLPNIAYCFPETVQDVIQILHKLYGTAGQAASIGGLMILDGHGLSTTEASVRRKEWLPLIYATLASRMSSLGNAPHDAWLGARHALMNGVTLYARPRFDMLKGLYKGSPQGPAKIALCLASGPSLAQYLPHIKAIQKEHIIIATDSIYKGLIEQGIYPDFVTVVERTDDMHRLFDGTEWKSEGTWCVALPLVHPSTLATFRHRVIWWWNKDALYPWIDPQLESAYSGRSAGTLTVALAGWLGVEKAYLVGHDLAYGSDGTTHSPTVADFTKTETVTYEKSVDEQNDGKLAPTFRHQQHELPANGGGTVWTNGTWLMFKGDIEAIIPTYPDTEFVNVNRGEGALINGATCAPLPEPTGIALERTGRHQQISGMKWSVFRRKVGNLFSDLTHFSKQATSVMHWLSALNVEELDEKIMAQVAERTTITSLLGPDRISTLTDNIHFFNFIFCPSYNCYLLECHKQAKESRRPIERRYKIIVQSVRLMEVFAALSMQAALETSAIVEEYFNKPTAHLKHLLAEQEKARAQEARP